MCFSTIISLLVFHSLVFIPVTIEAVGRLACTICYRPFGTFLSGPNPSPPWPPVGVLRSDLSIVFPRKIYMVDDGEHSGIPAWTWCVIVGRGPTGRIEKSERISERDPSIRTRNRFEHVKRKIPKGDGRNAQKCSLVGQVGQGNRPERTAWFEHCCQGDYVESRKTHVLGS